jgi:zinc protease
MINFEKHVLENGLTVILQNIPEASIANVNVLYKVGSRNETPTKTGLAHLFEHLMFTGTAAVPDYDTPIQLAGGENNAFTNTDFTNYYISVPKQNLDLAIFLEADRMHNLSLKSKKINVQKKVVVEEFFETTINIPYGNVWHEIRQQAYKNTAYAWPTIGLIPEHISQTTKEDLTYFYQQYYAPNNAILVVNGNINTLQVFEKIKTYFEPIKSNKDSNPVFYQNKWSKSQGTINEIYAKVPSNAIYISFSMERRDEFGYYVADFISDILSGGDSNRLQQNLVQQNAIFSEIDAYILGSFDKGLFVIEGKLNDSISFETAENAIFEELEKVKTEKLIDREFQKILNKIISYHVFGEISPLNQAMNLAYFEMLGNVNLINAELNNYYSINPTIIQEYAKSHFEYNSANILRYKKTNK